MTAQSTANGQQRRTLNETIARLDQMIEGLSTAIPETIGDTLKEAVGVAVSEGVRAALVEMLQNPDLLTALRGAPAPEPPPPVPPAPSQGPGLLAKVGLAVAAARLWSADRLRDATQAAAGCARKVVSRLAELRQGLGGLGEARRPLLLAVVAGGLAAVAALLAPQWVLATLSGLGGACVALAVQIGLWLRRGLDTLTPTSD
jgi:hypothetical protein